MKVFFLGVVFLLSFSLQAQQFRVVEVDRVETKAAVDSSAVQISNKKIIVGSNDGQVYFIAREKNNPLEVLSYQTGSRTYGSATELSDHSVVIGSSDGFLYRFNADGKFLNKTKIGAMIWSTPLELPTGVLVVGSQDGNVTFLTRDGVILNQVKLSGSLSSSPILVYPQPSPLKYLGYKTGIPRIALGSSDNSVYLLNFDGTVYGRIQTQGQVYGAPKQLLQGKFRGRVAVGSAEGTIHLIHPLTLFSRKLSVDGETASSPFLARNGNIIVTTLSGRVYAFNSSGLPLWQFSIPTASGKGPVIWGSSAELSDGTIVFGAADGVVYFLNPLDGGLKALFFLTKGKDPNSATGIWTTPLVLEDDTVVVGAQSFNVHFLRLELSH